MTRIIIGLYQVNMVSEMNLNGVVSENSYSRSQFARDRGIVVVFISQSSSHFVKMPLPAVYRQHLPIEMIESTDLHPQFPFDSPLAEAELAEIDFDQ